MRQKTISKGHRAMTQMLQKLLLGLIIPIFTLCTFECRADFWESKFLPPVNLDLYEREPFSLNQSETWKVLIHGIRMSPLHPAEWGQLRSERTMNRRLIPIRPLYLRASDKNEFHLSKISFRFRFAPVNKKQLRKMPHSSAPILDLGFGGRVELDSTGTVELVDNGYVLRLSGFPETPSGFLYRVRQQSRSLQAFASSTISTGEFHTVSLSIKGDTALVMLDSRKLGSITGGNYRLGLVSLLTDWHPIYMKELSIEGSELDENGVRQRRTYSGLVDFPAKKISKKLLNGKITGAAKNS